MLLLEHPPVYTAGKRTEPHERPVDSGGAPVIDVDRGGKITFHGPGQLVGYPIVPLPDHVKVVDYVRRVEEALIQVCADLGVTTARVPGRSGVWLRADDRGPERKVAALGIRVSRGVTMHGFALNCDVDLALVRPLRPVRHRRRRGHHAQRRARPPGHGRTRCCRRTSSTSRTTWPGRRTTPTPDYDARPDPAKQPRIELVTPSR